MTNIYSQSIISESANKHDLMLLENQLPFFVISTFFDMSYSLTQNPNQNPHTTSNELLTRMASLLLIDKRPKSITFP
ncbi:hypothetical protein ACSBR2_034344 [Camellia fascicularis]